jgi:hypothetical protein
MATKPTTKQSAKHQASELARTLDDSEEEIQVCSTIQALRVIPVNLVLDAVAFLEDRRGCGSSA